MHKERMKVLKTKFRVLKTFYLSYPCTSGKKMLFLSLLNHKLPLTTSSKPVRTVAQSQICRSNKLLWAI